MSRREELVRQAINMMAFNEGQTTVEMDGKPIAVIKVKATFENVVIVIDWL